MELERLGGNAMNAEDLLNVNPYKYFPKEAI